MIKHIKYLWYITKHRFWVCWYCLKENLFWQGIFHDFSKFYPDEWFPYANYFYGKKGKERREARKFEGGYYKPYNTGDVDFDMAWLKHQKRNKHHWQWWVLPEDDGGVFCYPMPDKYRIEMICDWRGAGRAQGYGDNTIEWYRKNKDKMKLHPQTRKEVELQLMEMYGIDKMGGSITFNLYGDKKFDLKEKISDENNTGISF